jgi:hypothetical protein
MKSNETRIVNVSKVIEVIKILRIKRLDLLSRLPDNPLERDRILRELENEIIKQLEINDYLTVKALDALIFVFDKPFADVVYTSIANDLEQLSKLKLQELKVEAESTWGVRVDVKLERLAQEEFKQHVQVLKSLKFRFIDLLKCWRKIYEAGKPIAHPLL